MRRLPGAAGPLVVASVAAAIACAPARDVRFVAKTWPADHTAVVVVTDELGAPITDPRVVPPGAPLVFDVEREGAVRVWAETWGPGVRASDGRTIAECGVAFGGEGARLPVAETHWRSELVELTSDADVVLTSDAAPLPLELRYERCTAADPCAGLRATRVDVPPGIRTRAIAAIGPDAAIFAGDRPGIGDVIGRVDGGRATVGPEEAAIGSRVRDLAWDRADAVVGLLEGGAVFRVALDGRLVDVPRRLAPDLELEQLSFGAGVMLAVDDPGGLWRVTATATAVSPIVGAPTMLREAAAVGPERVFVRDSVHLYLFDGATWATEHETPLIENVSALGADDDVAVVNGELENVRVRDPASRRWERLPERPFDEGLRILAVTGAGGGRFLVGAERGRIALWTGRAWCRAEALVDVALSRIAVSTDQRVAWAVGDGRVATDGSTVLVRVELPERTP